MPPEPSRRERSKSRRRRAIQRAAFELFAEQGYDQTTLAEIAERADVALRTIPAYFPSKADLLVSRNSEIAARLVATFESRPDAGFLEVVDVWLRAEAEGMDRELAGLAQAILERDPSVAARQSPEMAAALAVGQPALIAETRLPEGDAMIAVVGSAVGAAVGAYFAMVQRAGFSERRHAEFLDYLATVLHGAARARR